LCVIYAKYQQIIVFKQTF